VIGQEKIVRFGNGASVDLFDRRVRFAIPAQGRLWLQKVATFEDHQSRMLPVNEDSRGRGRL
jgi:hypothetical protein